MPDQRIGRSVSKNAGSTGGTSLTVSPWTLRGVIPALGRTPALRGHPGGIDAAGPGWLGLTAGGDQPDPGPASAPGTIPLAEGGPGTRGGSGTGTEPRAGRRQRTRRARARGPATPRALAGAGGRSVWQQSMSAWREAGLEWQRPAGWEPADVDQQRTEPIPVVPAMVPLDAGPAAPPSGGRRAPGRPGAAPRARPGRSRRCGQPGRGGQAWAPGARAQPAASPARRPHGPGRCRCLRGAARRGGRWHRHHRPAGAPAAARPGWWWPTRPPGSPMRSSPGRAEHPRRRCRPRSPGWPRPAARWWRWARRPRFPSRARWSSRRPMAAARGSRPVLRAPAGGGMPLMVAGGHGRWLAVGPDAAWTSPDGRSWRLGPGVAPLAGGDRVQALAPDTRRVRRRGRERAPAWATISCAPRCSGCPPTASPGSAGARASLTFRPERGGWPACAGWPRAAAF